MKKPGLSRAFSCGFQGMEARGVTGVAGRPPRMLAHVGTRGGAVTGSWPEDAARRGEPKAGAEALEAVEQAACQRARARSMGVSPST